MKTGTLSLIALSLAFAWHASAAAADTSPAPRPAPQYGYGAGMMGGYGSGMMGGYGSGMMGGYGPGMMGGYGSGMMGGYGPGMMGGYGPGMMGGAPGYGPPRGYGNALSLLDLSSDQREKIAQIQESARERNWATMGELRAEAFKLRGLYRAEKPDPDAVAEQQKRIDELRRQLTKARVETHNQIQSVLTKEQREQLRANAPWWADDADVED